MQSQSQTFTTDELAILEALDAEARRRGRRITSHAKVFRVLKTLAYSQNPRSIDFGVRGERGGLAAS